MCTRYYMDPSPELGPISDRTKRLRLTRDMIAKLGRPLKTEGIVCPDDMVPVIAPDRSGNRKEFSMVWGFHVEGLDRPIINARIENCKKSDTFRESWERRRCVIPAAFYYEWSRVQSGGMIKPQDQYAIQPRGATATWFAGLYRIEEGHIAEFLVHLSFQHSLQGITKQIFEHVLHILCIIWLIMFQKTVDKCFSFW